MRLPRAIPLAVAAISLAAIAAILLALPLAARTAQPQQKLRAVTPIESGPHTRFQTRRTQRARIAEEAEYQPFFGNWFSYWMQSSQERAPRFRGEPAQHYAPRFGLFAPRGEKNIDSAVARHAAANGVPVELARRVAKIESGGNPRLVSKGNHGLMQIRLGTARVMGYRGDAAGLLDADTNMTYAMKYLAGAYRVAGGNPQRAIALYQRGYYYEAKRAGMPYGAQAETQSSPLTSPFARFAWNAPDDEDTPRRSRRARAN